MSDKSVREISADILRMLGVDPEWCTHAEIIIHADAPITINAEFEVIPHEIDEEMDALKTEMKRFVVTEIDRDE